MSAMSEAKPEGAVAIIAIHGVGNQERCETARTLAELMQRGDSESGVSYTSFDEHEMVLPVTPIKDELKLDVPTQSQSTTTWIGSQSEFMKTGQFRMPNAARGEPAIDVAFTRACVNVYDAKRHTKSYNTIRLAGVRRAKGESDRSVDIFEMYWGDLSRLGNAWIAVIGELYQLLLHAGSIARITAEMQHKAAESNTVRQPLLGLLASFRWLVTSTIWLSTVPLVAANVVMLAVAMTILPLNIDALKNSAYAPYVGVVAAVALAYLLYLVMRTYDARRPGALKWTIAIMAIAAVTATISAATGGGYSTTVLRVVEVLFTLFWPMAVLIIKFILLALALGILCVVFKSQALSRASAIPRGVITAVTAMIVPLSLSCAFTLMLWGGAAPAFKAALSPEDTYVSVIPDWIYQVPELIRMKQWHSVRSQQDFVEFLLAHAGTSAFNWLIAGLAVALFLLVLGTVLSIRYELVPPDSDTAAKPWRIALAGRWLNAGLTWIPLTGLIVLIVLGAMAVLVPEFHDCDVRDSVIWCGNSWIRNAGLAFTTSSAGVLAIARAYGTRLTALRPGIDLALDVDNWLRERPRDSNPRAQILSRYLALFKHLHDSGYRDVVIVAHSQGTVITADFLRLLKHFSWREGLKIRLFTLGSPLRQLYAERFPDLYGWVTEYGGPQPETLYGTEFWLNGYRTGDYVGRALWEDLIAKPDFRLGPEPRKTVKTAMQQKQNHAEFSLGAGAHTHYFDYTAPMVVSAVDSLVAMPPMEYSSVNKAPPVSAKISPIRS